MIAIKDKYRALSPQIVPWMYPSEFERYLAEEAGKSGIAKKIYSEYYRSLEPIYHKKGLEIAFGMIEERPLQFKGLNPIDIYEDMVYCLHRFGFSFQDYCIYNFQAKCDEERQKFIADKARYHYCDILNAPHVRELMTNKYSCFEAYHKFFKREVVRCQNVSDQQAFREFIGNHPRFIYKPMADHSGHGIELVDTSIVDAMSWFYNTIENHPGIVEEIIEQGGELSKIFAKSVNSCRIVTFVVNNDVTIIGGALRMGRGNSIMDNAGSGGIYASIDINTGVLQSDAKDYLNQHCSELPDSHTQILGFQLPEWDKAVCLVKEMALYKKGTTLISWDIAYSDKGWLMVEANDNGDWSIIQSNLEKGMKADLYELIDCYFMSHP